MKFRHLPWRFTLALFAAFGLWALLSAPAHAQMYTVAINSPNNQANFAQATQSITVTGTVTPTGPPTAPNSIEAVISAPAGQYNNAQWSIKGQAGGPVPGSNPPQWQYSLIVQIGMAGFPGPGAYT